MNPIRPLHDRVLVRRVQPDEVTKGGLIIPVTAQKKLNEGIVIAVGTGTVLEDGTVRPVDVKKGDKVILGPYTGAEVKLKLEDKDDFIMVREGEILAVLEDG
jgi:chaperonin GroES